MYPKRSAWIEIDMFCLMFGTLYFFIRVKVPPRRHIFCRICRNIDNEMKRSNMKQTNFFLLLKRSNEYQRLSTISIQNVFKIKQKLKRPCFYLLLKRSNEYQRLSTISIQNVFKMKQKLKWPCFYVLPKRSNEYQRLFTISIQNKHWK